MLLGTDPNGSQGRCPNKVGSRMVGSRFSAGQSRGCPGQSWAHRRPVSVKGSGRGQNWPRHRLLQRIGGGFEPRQRLLHLSRPVILAVLDQRQNHPPANPPSQLISSCCIARPLAKAGQL